MSIKEMTVNLEFFRILFEGHKHILFADNLHFSIDLYDFNTNTLPYSSVEASFAS